VNTFKCLLYRQLFFLISFLAEANKSSTSEDKADNLRFAVNKLSGVYKRLLYAKVKILLLTELHSKERDRVYRKATQPTPSHGGGVRDDVLERIQDREKEKRSKHYNFYLPFRSLVLLFLK
jgi:hypothetical protein